MNEMVIKDRRAVQDTATVAPATYSPEQVLLQALRSGATVEEAERISEMMLKLREREDAREAERNYNAAFARAMVEMPPIPKDAIAKRGNAGSFAYSKLETILGKAQPVLGRHGLHLGFEVVQSDGKSVSVVSVLRHANGHCVRSSPLPSAIVSFSSANTPLQNLEGTLTALKRSLAMTSLGLAVGGEEEAQVGTPDQHDSVDVERISPFLAEVAQSQSREDLRAAYEHAKAALSGPDLEEVRKATTARKAKLEEAE